LEEKLILLTGAGHGKSLVCYDKHDGKPLWTALDDVTGYATPMVVTLAGQQQLIICAENRTVGLRIEDGKLLWEYPWRVLNDQLPVAQPAILSTNRFLLSAGYFTGCAAVEVTKTETDFVARTLWKNKNLKNKFTSSVLFEGYIYGLDEDILTCLDAATGERKWKEGRYGYGQLLLAGGYLVILSGAGELALVKATPERHEELARFQAIHGKTWNYPAIAHGRILVRNAVEMACFDILPGK
jgi:outer membrane protein assembly factor BamB